eukprot:1733686-Rhodomonas_salina.1
MNLDEKQQQKSSALAGLDLPSTSRPRVWFLLLYERTSAHLSIPPLADLSSGFYCSSSRPILSSYPDTALTLSPNSSTSLTCSFLVAPCMLSVPAYA